MPSMEGADPRPPAAETVPWRQNHPLAPTESVQRNQNTVADPQVAHVPTHGQNASNSLIAYHARHGGPYRKYAFDQVKIIHQNIVGGRGGWP
jgi:hypothetical protein